MRYTVLAVLLLASACGGSETPADTDGVDVSVQLRDTGRLSMLFNNGDGRCSSLGMDAQVSGKGADAEPVVVTLTDADGAPVARRELPEVGGEFSAGCSWSLNFPGVFGSDYYEATIVSGKQTATGSTSNVGQSAAITVRF